VRTRLQRNVRLYSPPGESTTANLDSLIDKILEKIHKEGDDSLTDVERDILRMGTEKLKRRLKA
jgi:transcription termination factor NusB